MLFSLLLALSAALWLLLPADKIISLAEQRIGEATGRECTIDGFGVSLWRGLALDLEGVELAAGEDEDVPYTARLEHLYLKIKLLPLLSKKIEVVSLIIDGPEIFAVRDKGGKLNLSQLVPQDETEEPAEDDDESFSLLLQGVVLEDGVLHYHDYLDSLRVTLAGIEGELSMEPAGPGLLLPLEGRLRVSELREIVPGSASRLGGALPVVVRFEGSAAKDWRAVELDRLTLIAGGVQLDGLLRLDLSRPDSLSWSMRMSGGADDTQRLSDLLLPADFPRQIDRFELEFESDSRVLTVENLALEMGEDQLALSGSVNLSEPYLSRANVRAELLLDGLKDFMELEQDWSAVGELNANLALNIELESPLKSWSVSGSVTADKIDFILPAGQPELSLSGLNIRLSGRDIERAGVNFTAAGSELEAVVSVDNWPGFLPRDNPLAAGRARWKLDAKSDNLDLVELLGPDYAGAEATDAGMADSLSIPVSLGDGRGSLTVKRLVIKEGVTLEDAAVWFEVRDSLLRVDSLAASFFGGRLSGEGEFLLAETGFGGWRLNVRADNAQAGSMMRPFSDIGQYLSGELSTSMEFRQGSEVDDLSGFADFSLTGGGLRDWPALNSISSLTRIEELRDLDIDDWVGRFEVRDGRVFGENLRLSTAAGVIGATGSVGLDGSLDYSLTLELNERLSNKYRGKLPGDIGRLLTGGSGNVELGFRLGGTTTNPSVKLDTRLVARRVENRLKEQAGKLLNRLLPGSGAGDDSTAADSAGTVKKSLRGLLKNLLKKN